MMNLEQQAILTLCMQAALADGGKDSQEQSRLSAISDSLAADGHADYKMIYQDVLANRVSVASAASQLATPLARQTAYELAASVCAADGTVSAAEQTYLDQLQHALGLTAEVAAAAVARGNQAALASLTAVGSADEPAISAAAVPANTALSAAANAELDSMIQNYAILNGALELLPEKLASMAIVPLQMRMVYRVGKAHGYELDRTHIKDFLATAGVGMTSQYLEQISAKLIGGLLARFIGSGTASVARQATSSAFSFASTYALGHLSKRYYAGGRTLTGMKLQESFQGLLGEAKQLQGQFSGQIAERARSLNLPEVLKSVGIGR